MDPQKLRMFCTEPSLLQKRESLLAELHHSDVADPSLRSGHFINASLRVILSMPPC